MSGLRRIGVLIAAAGLAVASCGNDDDTTAVQEDSNASSESESALTETAWEVDLVQDGETTTEAPEDVDATLGIHDGQIGGNTGCNAFTGDVEVSEDQSTIIVSDVVSTLRACMDTRGELDQIVLGTLRGELTVEIDGDVLTLTNEDGTSLTLRAIDENPEDQVPEDDLNKEGENTGDEEETENTEDE
ncbi:META domain-containing protein [Phytoactinopolyspora halophila]|nr:META domain-containing protein [Phytoactinopolyspora halophila]